MPSFNQEDSALYFEKYAGGTLGLKSRDGKPRSVPEGTAQEWRALAQAIAKDWAFKTKRLAYMPRKGVYNARAVTISPLGEILSGSADDILHFGGGSPLLLQLLEEAETSLQ
jgi:hypothetical protein